MWDFAEKSPVYFAVLVLVVLASIHDTVAHVARIVVGD